MDHTSLAAIGKIILQPIRILSCFWRSKHAWTMKYSRRADQMFETTIDIFIAEILNCPDIHSGKGIAGALTGKRRGGVIRESSSLDLPYDHDPSSRQADRDQWRPEQIAVRMEAVSTPKPLRSTS